MTADLSGPGSIDPSAGRTAVRPVPGGAGTAVALPRQTVARAPTPRARPREDVPAGLSDAVSEQPLKGSGLDPLHVLATTDRIARRSSTGSVALEVGLEQARYALLRNQPGLGLAALDEIWDGARKTEEGWYLRGGALAALGLPGEADRVADDGLVVRPSSNALRFLQSVARMLIGDFRGARSSLLPAITRAPFDPVLLVQHAVLQARAGDPSAANIVLRRLGATQPDHPALAWGQGVLRAAVAEDTRSRSRLWQLDADIAAQGADLQPPVLPSAIPDYAGFAFEQLGARVGAVGRSVELAEQARGLLRALSSGGQLASSMTGEQAHAARMILMTMVGKPNAGESEAQTALRHLLDHVVALLEQGRAADARLFVQRQGSIARAPVSRLLLSIIRGASWADAGTPQRDDRGESGSAEPAAQSVRGEADRGPLPAVRLGLGLLEETAKMRAADLGLRHTDSGALEFGGDEVMFSVRASGGFEGLGPSAEEAGEGWGAVRSAEAGGGGSAVPGPGRLPAVLLVALAVLAIGTGHVVVATLLAATATGLGISRRGPGAAATPAHTQEDAGARLPAVGEDVDVPTSP